MYILYLFVFIHKRSLISTVNKSIIELFDLREGEKNIALKVLEGERITPEEALLLYRTSHLSLLGVLANQVRERINSDRVFFNRNFHLEPTNICINHCKFCSYRRRKGQKGAWECSIDEMVQTAVNHSAGGATEVHIVGGVHPERDIYFYVDLLNAIRTAAPHLHIKAFTAVEVDQMCQMAGISIEKGLKKLKEAGLESMPGGGAEIFDETLRARICPDKTSSEKWLQIHGTAHEMGIPTNATMLYGLLENYEHRVDHLDRLRRLQDKTKGFNAFIPLKFKRENNAFSGIRETTLNEDLKNYAVSRIYLDNIPHLKAYWPMIGKQPAQLSLAFGVDDLDGTIDDSTRIYTMAGGEEKPAATTSELIRIIHEANRTPVERNSIYQVLKTY